MVKKYRPRGIYIPTGRDSYITTIWYRTEKEAKDAMRAFTSGNPNYKNKRIVSKVF